MKRWRLRMKLKLSTVLVLALLLASPSFISAQEEGLRVNLASFSTEGWPQAQAVVTVLGPDGRAVAGLAVGDFQSRVNDSPAPVTTVTQGVDSSLGIAVVLVLDVSGSMSGAALEQAQGAAHSFVAGLGPNDTVAIVAFADTVSQLMEFTQDRAAADGAIDGLEVVDGTALYQAAAWGVGLAASSGTDRRAVVLLSDGVDTKGVVSRDDALARAEALGVPVFSIGLGPEVDRSFLEQLANGTGGRFAETPSPEGLAQLYLEVGELLRGQYILTLDGSGVTMSESGAATVLVEVTAGGTTASSERTFTPHGPAITLSGIEPGVELEGETSIAAEVVSADPVVSVTFLVDGREAAEVTQPPYVFTFDPGSYPAGVHTVGAKVTTTAGESGTAEDVPVRTVAAGGRGAGGGAADTMIIAGAGVMAAGLAAAAAVFLFRRRRAGGRTPEPVVEQTQIAGVAATQEPSPAGAPGALWPTLDERPAPPEIVEPSGMLMAVSGSLEGRSYPVNGTPASIGSGHRCSIRLEEQDENGEDVAPEMARVWVRGGQLMMHEIMRLTAFGPVGGNWSILDSGDTFSVGEWTFRFDLEREQEEETETDHEIPNVLRDHGEPTDPPAPRGSWMP